MEVIRENILTDPLRISGTEMDKVLFAGPVTT
jgi:hypothetical protein